MQSKTILRKLSRPLLLGGVTLLALTMLPRVAQAIDRVDQQHVAASGVLAGAGDVATRTNAALNLTHCEVAALDLPTGIDERIYVGVPLSGEWFTLELHPHSVRAPGYQLLVQVDDGSLQDATPTAERTLRGQVIELPGTTVAASLLEDGLYARVLFDDPSIGEYWIEPIAGRVEGAAATDHAVYHRDDVIPSGLSCGADLLTHPEPGDNDGGFVTRDACGDGVLCIADLACDADYQFYQRYGYDVSAVETRINNVINTMNVQYERDVEITHQITAIIVRSSLAANPYTTSDSSALLSEFRSEWIANHSNIVRDIAELFTNRNLSGSVIGIAWVGAVCTNYGYSVVQSSCCGSLSCSTDLSAHEIGHNWSANHCTCTSYTMNPSLTCSNQFHPTYTVPDIVSYRNGHQGCLDAGGSTLVYCAAGASSTADEYIANVTLGSINNSTSSDSYTDYTYYTTNIEVGSDYSLTVMLGSADSTDLGGVWIDWNQDEDFDDADETITTGWSGSGPYTVTISPVQGVALEGYTRMRVRIQDGQQDPTVSACGTTSYGEVEDYSVRIIDNTCQAPGVTMLSPLEQTVCEGDLFILRVEADTELPTYQWRRGTTDLVNDGVHITGAQTSMLGILGAEPGDSGADYNCLVSDAYLDCPAVSDNYQITVGPLPLISDQPADQTVSEAAAVEISVVTDDTGSYTFAWQYEGSPLSDGGTISGASTATLSISSAALTDAGSYDCVITSAYGCVTISDTMTLTVQEGTNNCPEDLDSTGLIDLADLQLLLGNYGQSGLSATDGDFDGDGDVDLNDLQQLLAVYGQSCPTR